MFDELGRKVLKREHDHARLGGAASCVLEDLFIIHHVYPSIGESPPPGPFF
jgi:hypothetical protein